MIYFLQSPDGGPIKIGTTMALKVRLAALEAECGHPLTVLGIIHGSYQEERTLHRNFAPFVVNGEWFSPAQEILDFIAANAQEWNPSKDECWAVSCRLPAPLRDVVTRLSREQRRSAGQMLILLVEHGLKSLGYLPPSHDSIPFFSSLSPRPPAST